MCVCLHFRVCLVQGLGWFAVLGLQKLILHLGNMFSGCSIHVVGTLQLYPTGKSCTNPVHLKNKHEKYLPEEVFSNCPYIVSETWLKSNLNFFKMSGYWKSQQTLWKLQEFQPKWWDTGIWKKEFVLETLNHSNLNHRSQDSMKTTPWAIFKTQRFFYFLSWTYMLQFFYSSSSFIKLACNFQSVHYVWSPFVCSEPVPSWPLSEAHLSVTLCQSLCLQLSAACKYSLGKAIVITFLLCDLLQTRSSFLL